LSIFNQRSIYFLEIFDLLSKLVSLVRFLEVSSSNVDDSVRFIFSEGVEKSLVEWIFTQNDLVAFLGEFFNQRRERENGLFFTTQVVDMLLTLFHS